MLSAALKAAVQTVSRPFRAVLLKSLGLTVLLLILGWIGLQALADRMLVLPNETATWIAHLVAGLGTAFGLLFLVTPVTAIVAGFFLDDVAEIVERTHYPADAPGQPVPLVKGLFLSLRFAALVLSLNLLLLALLFIPGVNLIAWLGVNGYLLGREYFSLAAMRFRDEDGATALRRRHRGEVFAAGLLVATLAIVPFANLLTPLFATAFFVHLHKSIAAEDAKLLGTEGRTPRLGA
ncbi:sulfate transporter family protein [Hansschlegelia quercus]|uniref:Sulfate transporter family protein n=1 Tax=Hansschlegelia quercus TaxID=2528245 RepID=A0A4Q9G9R6_9HYPH|nr:sulfate transporter family protein [Hansschlegelia quercus]TBN47627.1 sulfate transporter family protein [Hansschlegelia quercus]